MLGSLATLVPDDGPLGGCDCVEYHPPAASGSTSPEMAVVPGRLFLFWRFGLPVERTKRLLVIQTTSTSFQQLTRRLEIKSRDSTPEQQETYSDR